jgi:hypothetical protein
MNQAGIGSQNYPGVGGLFCLALAAAGVAALHAGIEARDLNADGPTYLLSALSSGGLALIEPGRMTVQFLQQSLSFAGYLLGVTDLLTLGRLLTFGMQGWPVLLTGLCWFALPRNEKTWILGPLLNIAVVIPAASFQGIGEGMIASCLMWLLFFLVEFDSPGRFRLLAAIALAGACFTLHEAAFPFLFGIALLAGARAREARGFRRMCFILVALLAIAAAIHLLYLVIYPRDAINRGAFLFSLFSDAWVAITPEGAGVNLPAFAGLAIGLCLLLVHFPVHRSEEQRQRLLLRASWWSIGFFAVVAGLFLAAPEWVTISHTFHAARGLPIMATMVMAGAIHLLRRSGKAPDRLAPIPIRAVLVAIIPMHLVMQTVLTTQWASYRHDLSDLIATRNGIIAADTASAILDPQHTYLRGALVAAWSIQPLSIVLAPEGRVRSIVDARPNIAWKPYRLDDPATLPLCTRGLDWSPYLTALRYAGADPKAGCLAGSLAAVRIPRAF